MNSSFDNSYADSALSRAVITADVDTRATFITRTYVHLFGAIAAFTLFEVALFQSGAAQAIAQTMLQQSWLLVLGAFVLVSWMASGFAHRSVSRPAQYAGLALYVVAEGLIFVPLLYVANLKAPGVISSAGIVTLGGFTALTMICFFTRKDFSFLRGILMWSGVAAVLLIVASLLFGFQLGTYFSVGMVALAGASILYDTSRILREYPEDRYVSASLQLFASVALMFWYVLRLFIGSDRK